MTPWTTFWLAVFLLSACVFFALALVISILGFKDLKSLLSKSEKE